MVQVEEGKGRPSWPRAGAHEWTIRGIGVAAAIYMTYYIAWRWTSTLNPSALGFSIVLALAESYIVLRAYFTLFETWKLEVREPAAPLPGLKVDVFVTTYNEPVEVLRKTVLAAREIRYPHRTWVLDDGKREEVRYLCRELGVHYLRRRDNANAKAGNLNNALRRTRGDFILQLDADHVPLPHILDRLLGYFRDPAVAFVQSPQDFYNSDSFMHNVKRGVRRMWDEQRFFFTVNQPGRDHWNASFFCGSCGVIRRAALRQIGGFRGETITEDMETSIVLHGRGWQSRYHAEPLAYGLAPDNLLAFQVQRLRWAQGTMQIFRKYNPLTYPGLTLAQRICYFDSFLYYFEGVAFLVFYLTPAIYLLTGVLPIRALDSEFLLRFLPYLLLSLLSFELLARGTGLFWLVAQFTLARAFTYTHALGGLFARGRLKFNVTPKRPGHVPFKAYGPHVLLGSLLLAAIGVGTVLRLRGVLAGPGVGSGAYWISVLWAGYTAVLAVRVVQLARAGQHQREDFRFRDVLPARYRVVGGEAEPAAGLALTEDLNRGGVALRSVDALDLGAQLRVSLPLATRPVEVTGEVVHRREVRAARQRLWVHGIRFLETPPDVGDAIELHCTQHAVPAAHQLFREDADVLARLARWLYSGRRDRRQPLNLAVEVVRVGEAEGAVPAAPQVGAIDDLSARGARLILAEPLPPDSLVQVSVAGSPLRFAGRVVVSRALWTPHGVRFVVGLVHSAPQDRATARKVINARRKDGGEMVGSGVRGRWFGRVPVAAMNRRLSATMRLVATRLTPVVALAIVAGGLLVARPAAAQQATTSPWGITIYNADEVATDNVQLFLLGASLAHRGIGVAPVLSAQGYVLHFPGTSLWAISPSVGLRDGYQGGQIQGRIGYTFVNKSAENIPQGAVAPGGNKSGVTLTGQLDQWGTGDVGGQVIGTYNFGAHTLWSRGRLSTRLSRTASGAAIRLGGEAVFLDASKASYTAWEVGPTLEYNSPHFIGTFSAGPKFQNPGKTAAYFHLDLVFPM